MIKWGYGRKRFNPTPIMVRFRTLSTLELAKDTRGGNSAVTP